MKKGFTTIELIMILIVLAVVVTIAFYAVNNSIKKSKEGSLEATINNIIDSAKNYVLENDNNYSDNWKFIKLEQLKKLGYLTNKEYKNPVTNETLNGCVQYKWDTNNNQHIFSWSDDCSQNFICQRASSLHKEKCESTGVCASRGFEVGEYITFGNTKAWPKVLQSGDPFDCDVNNDGIYNSENERFYYVSGKDGDPNSEYAVLIYYNNTKNGIADNTSDGLIRYGSVNLDGPINAIANLPTVNQWTNITLSNVIRAITNELGGDKGNNIDLPKQFNYVNTSNVAYAARLLTVQEIKVACGITINSETTGELDPCLYLMENTMYSSSSIGNNGYWLENPYSTSTFSVNIVNASDRSVKDSVAQNFWGVRPVIEILKKDMQY